MTPESLAAVDPARLHAAFGAAFADYLIGPFTIALAQWPQFLARQGVDLTLSRAVCDAAGDVLAFALVAPRRRRWRLATMGAVPAARGGGTAPRLLDDFIGRAREAGLGEVELEVFAQNERALRLYESRGFAARHELHGWQAPPPGGEMTALPAGIERAGRDEAFAWIDALPFIGELPLQVTPVALAASPVPLQAFRLGRAQLLFAETAPGVLTISSLIDTSPAQADALALVRALRAAHPVHRSVVPALQRLDVGGQALRDAGFERQPLHQLLMRAPV